MKIERLTAAELPPDSAALLTQQSLLGSPGLLRCWDTVGGSVVIWGMEEQGTLVAMLPGVEFRRRPLTRFQAAPDGLYLRIIRPDPNRTMLDSQELLLAKLCAHGYVRIYLSDYFRELGEMVKMTVAIQSTQVIELRDDWEPPDATLRSEIRKAEREGVVVSPFDLNQDLPGFIRLMQTTEQRHGRQPKYPEQFFVRLAQLAQQDTRVRWYHVASDGQPVASHIYLLEGETALNWQIYYDKQFSSLKANQLLTYHAARELWQGGVRFLNMGATPPDAEGVKAYKEKWGGRTVAYPCFVRKSLLGRLL